MVTTGVEVDVEEEQIWRLLGLVSGTPRAFPRQPPGAGTFFNAVEENETQKERMGPR